MKIAVLMGGDSPEREISIKTGKAVEKVLLNLSYDVVCVDFFDDLESTIPKLSKCDFVFNALHGGIGENGTVQGFLDCLKIPYTGSGVNPSSIGMDKHISKTLVSRLGYETPSWKLVSRDMEAPIIDQFPVIVKPNALGSTIGLSLVKKQSGFKDALNSAFNFDENVLIESFISGREIACSIVGNKILPLVEIIPSHELYDFECKYSQGKSSYIGSPELAFGLVDEIKRRGKSIFDHFGCSSYGRVDFLVDSEDIPWFLELNTLPGMTSTSLMPMAAIEMGWSFEKLLKTIVQDMIS